MRAIFGRAAGKGGMMTKRARPDSQLLVSIIDSMVDSLVITDVAGIIVYCNPATVTMFGYSASELNGRNVTVLMDEEIAESHGDYIKNYVHTGESKVLGVGPRNVTGRHRDGKLFPVELSLSEAGTGANRNFIGRLRSTATRVRDREKLELLRQRDNLTGLPNRASFMKRLDETLKTAGESGKSAALILLNLDRFRIVNDGLGHEAGDILLTRIAQRLLLLIGPNDLLSRLAGDEFAVLCPDADDSGKIYGKVRKLQDAFRTPVALLGQMTVVSACFGLSVFPADGTDGDELLKNATVALSSAKKSGHDQLVFYSADLNAKSKRRLSLEGRLQQALRRDEFSLHYQPKVDVPTGQVKGVEALIRWNCPELGPVSPAEFIPSLEETGLIQPVGEWVLAEACRANRAWQDAALPELSVGVNLSPLQFQLQNLPGLISETLRQAGLDARYLDIEITEGMLIEDVGRTAATLGAIREMGATVSLDDFGTGYSSLSYLRRLPIDTIKIDQAFIENVTTDPDSAAITQSIIAMAHKLKLKVVAEGVETVEQLAFLARHDCDQIQGYYFSKPLPEDEFRNLLQEGARFDLGNLSEKSSRRTLLIVDDEDIVLSSLVRVFRREDYHVLTVGSGDAALGLLACNDIGVIISDQRMPGMTGAELLSRVREMYPPVVRIVLSAFSELEAVIDSINRGAIYKFLTKPWDNDLLREHVRDAFTYYELLQNLKRPES